jgi:spore protease
VLVVGLGNEKYACDSLGAKVTQRVLVTKPYLEKGLFSPEKLNEVYAVSLGVYGTTGLDSSEVIESICKFILPDLVVVIDSMVSSSENTLAKSVQISDTKLIPGGGVGNSRKEISKDSVGAPVFAVGVPLVVNLNQICKTESDLIVTPKDVETKVCVLSKIIAKAINLTFSKITEKELYELTE